MTLTELRTALAELDHLPGDTLVVLATDSEGNGYSPLEEVDLSLYRAQTEYSGDHYLTEAERQAQEDPDDYDKAPDEAVPAVFLWPTN